MNPEEKSAEKLVKVARRSPNPARVMHLDGNDTNYVCHFAVVHWACEALDLMPAMANHITNGLARTGCNTCIALKEGRFSAPPGRPSAPPKSNFPGFLSGLPFGKRKKGRGASTKAKGKITIPDIHSRQTHLSSIWEKNYYGRYLCSDATRIPSQQDIHRLTKPGDILITQDKLLPMHSMVVVESESDGVLISGFNNQGTFSAGPYGAFDRELRNVADDKYWHGQSRFGPSNGAAAPLFVVPHKQFMRNLKALISRLIDEDWVE